MDKRRSLRFEGASSIKVSVVEPKNIGIKSVVKDASRVGLKLFVAKPLRKGQELQLALSIPSKKKAISLIVKVRRAGTKKTKDGYETGVEFLYIKPEDKAELLDFFYEEWKSHLPKIKF